MAALHHDSPKWADVARRIRGSGARLRFVGPFGERPLFPTTHLALAAICVTFGFTHLHGRKLGRWIHVGPLDQPISDEQVRAIVREAATTDIRAVDVLSADIPVDWNPSGAEYEFGVRVYAKVIPQAAVDAVRERLKRRRRKDPDSEPAPDIHFFTPPDVEIAVAPIPAASPSASPASP